MPVYKVTRRYEEHVYVSAHSHEDAETIAQEGALTELEQTQVYPDVWKGAELTMDEVSVEFEAESAHHYVLAATLNDSQWTLPHKFGEE